MAFVAHASTTGASRTSFCPVHAHLQLTTPHSSHRSSRSVLQPLSAARCCGGARAVQVIGVAQGLRPASRSSHICRAATEEEVDVETDTMERMETTVKVTKEKFATLRTGRASPTLLDLVKVDYYGEPTQLRSLANVTAPESSLLVVQPFDKGSMDAIEKAIFESNLGLTPNNDGKLIRINVPQLTAERRKEMVKQVSKLGEEGKVAIRNVRRDAMKTLEQQEKAGDLSEDEQKALEDSVQEITDDSVKQIDDLVKAKSKELTTV